MFIAQQKRRENIAEYILYMWQIEDIIRAYDFNIEAIVDNIVNKTAYDAEAKALLREWYESLVEMMRLENIQRAGHLQFVKNTLADITDLHYALLKSPRHAEYSARFYQLLPTIGTLKQRQNNPDADDMEACFVFLYGVLMLRLQHKELSGDTQIALKQIGELLSLLSSKYRLYLNNELKLDETGEV